MPANTDYERLVSEMREIALISSSASLLHWDEQTNMPTRGAVHRSEQLGLLARLAHERFTAPLIGQLLASIEASELAADPRSEAGVNVREIRQDYDRAVKLPASLVAELSRTASLSHKAWAEARAKSEFKQFLPWLAKILELKRQQAECLGYSSDIYDALLDEYEPGATSESVRTTFESLRGPLVELIQRVTSSTRKAPVHILERNYPAAAQERLAREAAAAIGFDFTGGRLDTTVHPFCTDIGPGDVRILTRYDEKYFGDAFFSVLHEAGHGMYEQGLPPEQFGLPRGKYVSLGIHESQSRLWENLVGRSRSFWRYYLPKTRAAFPEALSAADVTDEAWYFAVNDVRPSLIRTDADETTYNLHVLMRFELERAMLRKELSPAELPGAWNEKMQKYLGLTPPDDARGCLQDVHWSEGMIGYFPTYTLGNLCASQFFERAGKDLGGLGDSIARGEFTPLLDWLRKNIHSQGMTYRALELVERVTGRPLSSEPLLRHLRGKASELYGV